MTYRDHYYESIRMPINQYQQLSLFQRRKHLAQLLTLLSHLPHNKANFLLHLPTKGNSSSACLVNLSGSPLQ